MPTRIDILNIVRPTAVCFSCFSAKQLINDGPQPQRGILCDRLRLPSSIMSSKSRQVPSAAPDVLTLEYLQDGEDSYPLRCTLAAGRVPLGR